jgi:hypothetical protein
MKKIQLISAIILILLFCANAETYAQRFGLQAGVDQTNFANFEPDDVLTSRLGCNVGMSLEFPASDNMDISFSILYSLSGAKVKDRPDDDQLFYNLHYYDVPLTLSYRIPLIEDRLSVLPMAGIFGKIMVGATLTGQQMSKPIELKEDATMSPKHYDVGLTAGGIVEISKNLQIVVEYQHGFMKVFKNEWDKGYGNNTGLRISLRMFIG